MPKFGLVLLAVIFKLPEIVFISFDLKICDVAHGVYRGRGCNAVFVGVVGMSPLTTKGCSLVLVHF